MPAIIQLRFLIFPSASQPLSALLHKHNPEYEYNTHPQSLLILTCSSVKNLHLCLKCFFGHARLILLPASLTALSFPFGCRFRVSTGLYSWVTDIFSVVFFPDVDCTRLEYCLMWYPSWTAWVSRPLKGWSGPTTVAFFLFIFPSPFPCSRAPFPSFFLFSNPKISFPPMTHFASTEHHPSSFGCDTPLDLFSKQPTYCTYRNYAN